MTPSSSRRWAALVLGVALTFGPSSPVQAQAPAPTNAAAMTPAQRAEWERLRAEGKAAAQTREWMKALKAYEGAWQIHKDWNLAANLGKMELNLGKLVEAAGHLEYAVREAPKNLATDAPDEWAALGELQRKARAKVGALVINVEPAGAEVLVNGLAVGKAPLPGPVFVLPGAVTVEARAEGFALGSAPTQAVAGHEQLLAEAPVHERADRRDGGDLEERDLPEHEPRHAGGRDQPLLGVGVHEHRELVADLRVGRQLGGGQQEAGSCVGLRVEPRRKVIAAGGIPDRFA